MTVLKSTARHSRLTSQLFQPARANYATAAAVVGPHRARISDRTPPCSTEPPRLRIAACRPCHSYHLPITPKRNASSDANRTPLNRTGLYKLHKKHGGKMVPFAGYEMPIEYSDMSIGESHRWTRENVSLFDVGHMVQHIFAGPGASAFLELITPTSIAKLELRHSTLSCLLHPQTGGIVDDTVITRLAPESFYLVTNAACKEKDLAYLQDQLDIFDTKIYGAVDWKVRDDWGLVALQGPKSAPVLKSALASALAGNVDLEDLMFGQCKEVFIQQPGNPAASGTIQISRGGYTGEDGFEIALPPGLTEEFTELILEMGGSDAIRLAGLGARDSLRLEAGMCLYGHDLDDSTTPVEAGLSWVVAKDRRAAEASAGFHGAETILRQLKPAKEGGGVTRRRVGLVVEGSPAREGAEVYGPDPAATKGEGEGAATVVGKVTSGCPSPTLNKNIAMAYVANGLHKAGTELEVKVREKLRKAVVTKMPFVPSRYWKGKTGTAPA